MVLEWWSLFLLLSKVSASNLQDFDNCYEVIEHGYLKYRCSGASDRFQRYRCLQDPSVIYKEKTQSHGSFLRVDYSSQCPSDPYFYQVCGTSIVHTSVYGPFLCGRYNCQVSDAPTKYPFRLSDMMTCNGLEECLDGADEKYCEDEDQSPAFCDNTRVIQNSERCDGLRDCPDRGEDEIGCEHGIGLECTSRRDTSKRIWLSGDLICDGEVDCEGGEDEVGCGEGAPRGEKCITDMQGGLHTEQFVDYKLFCSDRAICVQDFTDQLNCTSGNVLECAKGGFPTMITGTVVCNKTLVYNTPLCDDHIDTDCRHLGTSNCYVHKHYLCDGIKDCPISSYDEETRECSTKAETTCRRRVHRPNNQSELSIPLAWLCDGVRDCEDGRDEDHDQWKVCGSERSRQRCYPSTWADCEEMFVCEGNGGKESTFVTFEDLCDGVESCAGVENTLCRVSRYRHDLMTHVGENHVIGPCLRGIQLPGVSCRTTAFRHPFPVYGVRDIHFTHPHHPFMPSLKCEALFGEMYVYGSCLGLCEGYPQCPITLPPSHVTCPLLGETERVVTLARSNDSLALIRSANGALKNDFFACSNGKCITFEKVCNLADDCGDFSDEEGCINQFRCTYPGHVNSHVTQELIPITSKCDTKVDCSNFADECNDTCGREIINTIFLKVTAWVLGILGITLNLIVITRNTIKIPKLTSRIALTNCTLITTVSFGQLLTGFYLIAVAITDLSYGRDYCVARYSWLISYQCNTIGILSTTGTHISLLSVTLLSVYRLYVINTLAIAKGIPSITKVMNITSVAVTTSIAVTIAAIPVLPSLNDYFINGVYYGTVPLFMGAPNKRQHLAILSQYYGRFLARDNELTWDEIDTLVRGMFTEDHGGVVGRRLGFYGNAGVCLFKYFVSKDDPQVRYSWSVIILDATCFITIVTTYILLNTLLLLRKKLRVGTARKSTKRKAARMHGKITLIILTDCLSWLPFLAICLAHFLSVYDGTMMYPIYSLFISPINSVINPILYDNGSVKCISGVWRGCLDLCRKHRVKNTIITKQGSYENGNFEGSSQQNIHQTSVM